MTERVSTKVIFVDDEVRILDGLRRQFRSKHSEWDMRFANSGEEALVLIGESEPDVIISDMRMPGMSGTELLAHVREACPHAVRLILSAQTDQNQLLASVGAIHQYLQKPCDPGMIIHAVRRTQELANQIESSRLRDLVSSVESLPVLSSTYTDLCEAISDDAVGFDAIAGIVRRDIGLSTKLFQMVNSAFFGLPRKLTDVQQAISLIGIQRLRVIAIASQIIDSLAEDDACSGRIERLWKASADIGAAAATAAKEAGNATAVRELARLSGTVSLIGRALLVRLLPAEYEQAMELTQSTGCGLSEAENQVFGASQQTIGAFALGLWAFDDEIVDSVAHQAQPGLCRDAGENHPAWFVHLARNKRYGDMLADQLPLAVPASKESVRDQDDTVLGKEAA